MRFSKTLMVWHFFGAIAIMSLASLWHFIYTWIPGSVTAVFFPVNESVWEQVKLFLLPSIIFYVVEYFAVGYKFRNYIFAHGVTLLLMPALMLGMFYFYSKGLGIEENLVVDIIITFLSICIGLYAGYRLTIKKSKIGNGILALIIAVVLCAAYGLLTFFPPQRPIFLDRNTNKYGIEASEESSSRR